MRRSVLLVLLFVATVHIDTVSAQFSDCNSNGAPDVDDVTSIHDYSLAPWLLLPGYSEEIQLHDMDGDGGLDLVALGAASIHVQLGGPAIVTSSVPALARLFRVARLNSDTNADVVIAHGNSLLSVYFGLGNGSFISGPQASLPAQASDLAVSDFDGDGTIDVVATVRSTNQVYVFLNTANGSLLAPAMYPVGLPGSIVPSDVDNDGDTDLVVASETDDGFLVLTNNGTGSFTVGAPVAIGLQPRSMAIDDLDGDGRADVVALVDVTVANGAVVWARNLPGQWQVNPPFPVDNPVDLVVADVVASSSPDVILMDRYGIQILENDGSGGVAAATHYSAGCDGADLLAGDQDGDGLTDLLVGNEEDRVVLMRGADGPDGWTPALATPNLSVPSAVLAQDLNGDSLDDLVMVHNTSVTVRHAVGAGRFVVAASIPVAGGSTPILADLNADGSLDLCLWNFASLTLEVYANNGSGTLSYAWATTPQVASPSTLRSAYLNADNLPDLVAEDYFWLNTGNGFAAPQPLPFVAPAFAVFDIDLDGLDELVVAHQPHAWVFDELEAVPTSFHLFPAHLGQVSTAPRRGQLDGRGALDLVLNPVGTLLSRGSDFLVRFGEPTPPGVLVDLDVDGVDEILELQADTLLIHESEDPTALMPTYSSETLDLLGCSPQLAAVGHFDADPPRDVVVLFQGGKMAVLRGQGAPAVSKDCNWNEIPDECEFPAGDVDGNGVLDDCETPAPLEEFIRGDCLVDGSVNLADPIHILEYLFQFGSLPPCLDACDVEADGSVTLSDAVYLLNHLFAGGSPPIPIQPPFPLCGPRGSSSLGPLFIVENCSDYSLCP